MTTIVWFRKDLRTADNPALRAAALRGPILPVYILDNVDNGLKWHLGGASKWWLHHSLASLSHAMGSLTLLRGEPLDLLLLLAKASGADSVCWNRCYEPSAIARDRSLKESLKAHGLDARSFNASLLNEPWEISAGSGKPYKVFTPYWRSCQLRSVNRELPAAKLDLAACKLAGERLADLDLLPSAPDWAASWHDHWTPGEAGAQSRLDEFLARGIDGYGERRNRPDLPHVSRLSPHLHWGEISPRQVVARARLAAAANPNRHGDVSKFLTEIGWREFSYHLLFHFPDLPDKNWKTAFDAYPWQDDRRLLRAWQRGMTGYPLVDAGMRELWKTGWMHNRVRMVTASFLVKHLRIDWRQGEAWFWDTLVDADLASNAASWQWVAGSGADAAPYFRIFNPVTQGEKFDPDGVYVRTWCPELANLPNAYIHAPFLAPASVLKSAGVELGVTYPAPIVDHAAAREAALRGYEAVKGKSASLQDQL